MSDQEPLEPEAVDHTSRDSESFLILGGFLAILATIVLIAAIFQEASHGRIVNFGAGFVLMGMGLSGMLWGTVLRKRIR